MHFTFRNVNDAFRNLVNMIHTKAIPTITTDSRNGQVIQIPEPVVITYTHPKERVLFNGARDANPFFHLYESLWMLAGRNDVEPLAYYNSKISQYSDDGKTFNGAYGHRWRHALTPEGVHPEFSDENKYVDQLQILIKHLKENPNSRRAVLQMWNVEDDLLKIEKYTYGECPEHKWMGRINGSSPVCPHCKGSKDVCGNTQVMFSIRSRGECSNNIEDWGKPGFLDMTVINRSNDMIWEALGANVVHFSFLQEYMAANIGVEVGVYNQISNNLHVYLNNWKPEEWLNGIGVNGYSDYFMNLKTAQIMPLILDPKVFKEELLKFVDLAHNQRRLLSVDFTEPFIKNVALPVARVYRAYKNKSFVAALRWCENINSLDWNVACTNWIERRKKNVSS